MNIIGPGAQRQAAREAAKREANAAFYANKPDIRTSRQVLRATLRRGRYVTNPHTGERRVLIAPEATKEQGSMRRRVAL